MTIRHATAGDRAAVRRVVTDAFGDRGEVADLVDDLRAAGRVLVELVAVEGDRVVGHVALDRCWVDDERALEEAVVLSPLAVAPDRQGSGTGTRLVAAALAAAPRTGSGYVFLEGAPGYYADRGFTRADVLGFARPSDRIPGPAFQVVVLEDRGVSGRVVYPDAFWTHDATGLRGEVLAQVRSRLGE
jgi:putative acetyltransferase